MGWVDFRVFRKKVSLEGLRDIKGIEE